VPIEDIGIAGASYSLTRDDLLAGNVDLIAQCIALLKQQPLTRLSCNVNKPTRTITASTSGLARVDALFDGHPGSSTAVTGNATTAIIYPAGTKTVDLTGWSGDDQIRQRRRISLG
jgi:hypothetical protein